MVQFGFLNYRNIFNFQSLFSAINQVTQRYFHITCLGEENRVNLRTKISCTDYDSISLYNKTQSAHDPAFNWH